MIASSREHSRRVSEAGNGLEMGSIKEGTEPYGTQSPWGEEYTEGLGLLVVLNTKWETDMIRLDMVVSRHTLPAKL